MKANHEVLIKAAELGIMRSMPDFLASPLQVGRLRNKFEQVGMIVDFELRKLYAQDEHFFRDNKEEIGAYLNKFGMIMGNNAQERSKIHIVSVVGFCLMFLEESKSTYPEKLFEHLKDILDYFEREKEVNYSDFWKGKNFYDEWSLLNE